MTYIIKKTVIVLVLFTFIAGSCASDIFAQNAVRKLGRGFANILTGFLELPQSIVDVSEEEGPLAAVTYGIVKGLALSVLRTGVGAYEIATFLIPLPSGYQPVLEPEFMMDDENY